MGHMRHHAIVVTSYDAEQIARAHTEAGKIFSWVSSISPDEINGYRSFFVPPDGSKEGWLDSILGDKQRDAFIDYLKKEVYDDGSSSLNWVEIQYGDDGLETRVVRSSDEEYARVIKVG